MEDAEIIRNWRTSHGYTQPIAAKVLRTSVPTVTLRKYQRYETGETKLPRKRQEAMRRQRRGDGVLSGPYDGQS